MAEWMKGAVKPSHTGLFAAKARHAGYSTEEYAKRKAHAPGALGEEARLAEVFERERPKKKAKKKPEPNAFYGE